MAFTPGAWNVYNQGDKTYINGHLHLYWCIESEEEGVAIVVAPIEEDSPEVRAERAATAALIASAPDLLAALEAVVSVADRNTVEFDLARAAIAKARGAAVTSKEDVSGA